MPVGAIYGQDNLVFTLATGRHQINVLGIGYDFAVALILLLVSFTENELGLVRIISARLATKGEEVMYVKHLG
jgi:uncharacterized DUF497 family protein